VTRPITAPGWYALGEKGGLEFVAPLDDPPEVTQDLVKVELAGETMTEEPLW
jgi:hypothetical protein